MTKPLLGSDLGDILHGAGGTVTNPYEADPTVGSPFGAPERIAVPWVQRLDRGGLLDLVRSRSYFVVADHAEQYRVLAAVAQLLDTHPDLAGTHNIELPYITHSWRYSLALVRQVFEAIKRPEQVSLGAVGRLPNFH